MMSYKSNKYMDGWADGWVVEWIDHCESGNK